MSEILIAVFGVVGSGLLGAIAFLLKNILSDINEVKVTVASAIANDKHQSSDIERHDERISKIEDRVNDLERCRK